MAGMSPASSRGYSHRRQRNRWRVERLGPRTAFGQESGDYSKSTRITKKGDHHEKHILLVLI